MSNHRGGSPPGRPAQPAGSYGPGQTVLGEPAFINDPSPNGGLPAAPYGIPPPPSAPHAAPSPYAAPPAAGLEFSPAPSPVVPTPPPRAPARSRAQRGPSMALIGAVAFVVIGGVTTLVVIKSRPTEDSEKPIPTFEVPTATAPPPDPPAASTPEPSAPPPPPPPKVFKPTPKPTAPRPSVPQPSKSAKPRPSGSPSYPYPPRPKR